MYAIIDIETTGGKFNQEHIMEIAIFVFDGKKIVDQFITLVNPEADIQPYVSKMTGITSNMLRRSPKFYEIAKRVVKITEECVFVAHNVKFDYRVVQLEFERLGFDFHRKTLDTIDLAKNLIPGLKTYGLEAMCVELGIQNLNRHRADGDARATVELFKILLEKDTAKSISQMATSVEESKSQHPFRDLVRPLKNVTGVYYIYNTQGEVVYIGMGNDLQNSINRHFLATNKTAVSLQTEANALNVEETGNVAIAHIKMFIEMERLAPKYNQHLNTHALPTGLFVSNVEKEVSFLRIGIVRHKPASFYFKDQKEAFDFLDSLFLKTHVDASPLMMDRDLSSLQVLPLLEKEKKKNKKLKITDLKKAVFIYPNFFAIGPGRHPNEKNLIMVKNYVPIGYAYYELDSFLDNLTLVKKHLTKLPNHPFVMGVVRHYIINNYLAVKPF